MTLAEAVGASGGGASGGDRLCEPARSSRVGADPSGVDGTGRFQTTLPPSCRGGGPPATPDCLRHIPPPPMTDHVLPYGILWRDPVSLPAAALRIPAGLPRRAVARPRSIRPRTSSSRNRTRRRRRCLPQGNGKGQLRKRVQFGTDSIRDGCEGAIPWVAGSTRRGLPADRSPPCQCCA